MKRKLKKRFFIALVLCFSLFNFSHFYQNESINNEKIDLSTIAYASDEIDTEDDDEMIIDPYTTLYSIMDWVEINITKLFTTDEELKSLPTKK